MPPVSKTTAPGRFPRQAARLVPWLVPAALLLVWQSMAMSGALADTVAPAPLDVIKAAIELIKSGELLTDIKISTARAVAGFVVGGGLGFTLGLLTALSRPAELLLDRAFQMVRTIPHLALLPLVILWFGIGEEAKLFLGAFGVFFPVYINTFHGVRTVDGGLIEMGRVYGMGRWELFHRVILPGALPSVFVGIRFALGVMWITLIVAETVSATSGIGYMAMQAREFMRLDIVVLAILMYALLGLLADSLTRLLERGFLRWHPAFQPQP